MINCIKSIVQLKGTDFELLAEYGCITHSLYKMLKEDIGEKGAAEMILDVLGTALTFDDEKNSVSDEVSDNRIRRLLNELVHELAGTHN